jgi:glycosyltransferase involved in cell wall biosynthesis
MTSVDNHQSTERIAVVALAKNEVEGLRHTSFQLRSILDSCKWESAILFVDGKSTDGSREFLQANDFEVIEQSEDGIQPALVDGLAAARKAGCSIVVMYQPDGNCDATKIPEMVEPLISGKVDLVIGSRYLNGMRSDDDTLVSMIGNLLFRVMFRLRFPGSKLSDPIVGFRAFRIELVDELEIFDPRAYRWLERSLHATLGFDPLMTTRALSTGKRILEIDAPEPPRIGGVEKKTSFRWGVAYSCQMWFDHLVWKRKREMGSERSRETEEVVRD